MAPYEIRMSVDELNDFLAGAFDVPRAYEVTAVAPGRATMTMAAADMMMRPGGTVSGPTLMAMADAAAYLVILAHLGPVALAVTSNLNITFLRKPQPVDLRAEATLLKLGRTLAMVDVLLYSAGVAEPVAQSTVTYAIPRDAS